MKQGVLDFFIRHGACAEGDGRRGRNLGQTHRPAMEENQAALPGLN